MAYNALTERLPFVKEIACEKKNEIHKKKKSKIVIKIHHVSDSAQRREAMDARWDTEVFNCVNPLSLCDSMPAGIIMPVSSLAACLPK